MIQGAPADVIRGAIERGDPLSGTGGFVGELESGTLVRDVLGRYPLFTEADDPTTYATDPTALSDPDPVPAGHRRDGDGDTRVFRLPDPAPFAGDGRAVVTGRAAVETSIAAVEGDPPVAFSGGLDSSLLAAGTDGRPFVGGCPDSDDVAAARSAAASLGRDLEVVEFTHDDLEAAVPEVVTATGRSNPMDIALAVPLYLVGRRAAAADLPAAVRRREKTAVQYGSDIGRELDRLARRAGFKRRMDDHVGRYVDSPSA